MAQIQSSSYGKTRVRLTHVDRSSEPHRVNQLSIAILLAGEFSSAFTKGDNSAVLPTDTMKNTAYILARRLSWNNIETLAKHFANHFLQKLSHVSDVIIEIEQIPWQQITAHASAFFQSGTERRTTRLHASREQSKITSGLKHLQILKTANSAFSGFLKDEFTSLPETEDRLLATELEAQWTYSTADLAFDESHFQIRTLLLDCFAVHNSRSVQHTLYAMASHVLHRMATVSEIRLVMPNKHQLLIDLTRFGVDNPNIVFVPTDEPSGYIEARITR